MIHESLFESVIQEIIIIIGIHIHFPNLQIQNYITEGALTDLEKLDQNM